MGCGQSKINLYRRRRKNNEKRNGAKKSGAIENEEEEGEEEEEEEEGSPEPAPEELEEPDNRQHVLPITDHAPAFEVSVSQQNFFKMLDEKIDQGKDYDSTSETEIECEQERRRMLIEHWRSLSTQSSRQSSPPTPAHRPLTRSVARVAERQGGPGTSRQPCRQQSPPARRSLGAQTHDSRPADWEPSKSPVKRTQSAGANRKCTKVAPFPKSKTTDDAIAGCSKDPQITTTYNPTFQSHSPGHKAQPYKAQIVSHPLSQQVAPPSPAKVIAPPEEYQDPEIAERQVTVAQVSSQSQIYYIHGSNAAPDLAQQRQQTALHLQQYVAMKQAQQQMFTSYMHVPRTFEGEELAAQYGHPGLRAAHSAPTRSAHEVAHLGAALWSPLPAVAGPWQVPPEMQYYPQSQFVPMFRAGSAGTLARRRGDPSQGMCVVRAAPAPAPTTLAPAPPSPVASSDSGVSPGSAPSSKSSGSTPPAAPEPLDPKPKKKKRALKISKSLDS